MKIFVSCGEVSGDLHLSYLVKSIMKEHKNIEFYGVAGKHSKEVGVNVIQDINELSIMGFTEVLKKYSFLKKKLREYIEFLKKEQIERVLLVDYGGFNLKFLEIIKKELPQIKVFYYIPPKLWVWGEKRVKKLRKADHIMVIFPWEVEFYKKHNIDVVYFGNPFVERYSIEKRENEYILLLPGSRRQEIKALIPVMLELAKKNNKTKYLLKLSQKEHLEWIEKDISKYENITIEVEKDLEVCVKKSKIAVAASGTVTLELALMGIPTIVVYKTNWINYFIAKYILKVGFVSLPNITVNREIFPELLQQKCNLTEIEQNVKFILDNTEKADKNIKLVIDKLSGENITEKYADFLLK